MTDVVAAAASDGRGAWLLEIYGDAESADLRLADAALRLLAAHAVRPAAGLRLERRAGTARARDPLASPVRGAYSAGTAHER